MRLKALRYLCVAAFLMIAACSDGDTTTDESVDTTGASEDLIDVTMRLDWIISGEHAHFFAAVDEGFFEDEGLNVEIFEGGGSALATQLVANGSNDFGLADFGVVVGSRAEGVEVVAVANLFQETPHALMSLESSGITGPESLPGKTIGGAAGSGAVILFTPYLESVGLSIDDVNMVQLDPAAYISSLYEGRIDAFPGSRISQYPILVTSAPEPPSLLKFSDGLDLASMSLIAHPDMVAERPEVVRAFVRAMQRAIEWTVENPEAAIENMTIRFPNTVDPDAAAIAIQVLGELAVEPLEDGQPIGYLPLDRVENTIETLSTFGSLDAADVVEPELYYTDQFLED